MDPNSRPEHAQQPVPAAPSPMYPVAAIAPATRPGRRWLLVLLLLGLFGSLMLNFLLFGLVGLTSLGRLDADRKVQEKYHSLASDAKNKIAIISIEGTILSGEGFVKRQIDRAMDDDDVKAVVLRVDSPGGSVTASDYLYHHLGELRKKKPIVVSMGGLAASGGYYVSMAVGDTPDSIFAEPTTWTGSIGVIIPHYDLSGLLENWNIKEDSIASGPLKQMGSFTKSKTEEERQRERAILGQLVDDSFVRFKQIIADGRPKLKDKLKENPQAIDDLATGQIYNAQQALDSGLIDEIAFVERAIARAVELAGLDADNVQVVEYKRELGLMGALLGSKAQSQSLDLAAMLDMAAPRAYYLCTWLPPLSKSP
ncbi:MAG TPA: signal peptide peptidase SppA [Thermoguttaceae bacterium]|nr:signal peptide peptidase SppA [Thermoguttaceae bacterium]